MMLELMVGDRVIKTRGYAFDGYVVACFHKLDGQTRYVVEHEEITGLLHIFNREQLRLRP